jgi:tRNA modification GTPase
MRGGFSTEIEELRIQLLNFASLIELELDFSEEDVEFANREEFQKLIKKITVLLKKLIDSFATGNVLKNGIPVAIVGRPNSGKSTLLNSLLNEERAIVSNIAGTTRDTIEDEITIGGIRFRFIDTAGLRDTTDEIEKIGVERALEKLEKSSIYIYLFDSTEMSVVEVKKELDSFTTNSKQLIVANKIDKASKEEVAAINNSDFSFLTISAKSKDSLGTLTNSLLDIAGIEALDSNQLMVTNSRHYDVLTKSLEEISKVQEGIDNHLTGDLLAIDLRQALYFLGEITGQVSNDDLLGNIFANFCIGK